MAAKKQDEELEDQQDEKEEEEGDEEELGEEITEIVQEFMGIPEIKGLVTEIAKDAAKRSADAVRNEAFNKLQKDFDSKLDKITERLDDISSSSDSKSQSSGGDEGEEGSGKADVTEVALMKRMTELDRRAKELDTREKKLEEAAEEQKQSALDSYRKGVVAEFGLQKVAHMVHGDTEDAIDDSVVEARKTLNAMRRDFVKEFKEKGWTPPPEELAEGDDSVPSSSEGAPTDLRKRFNYGPQQTPQGQQQILP